MLGKAMMTYESKTNKDIIKGYIKEYKKVKAHLVKANEKAQVKAKAASALPYILGGVAVVVVAIIIWCLCRKKGEKEE